jgi:hypothetical protein
MLSLRGPSEPENAALAAQQGAKQWQHAALMAAR